MGWETVSQIMVSVGSAGAIIIFVGKWLANLSAEAIIKKTEFEFSKKLEDFKSQLEKKNYISKTRFDLEIEIYRQLSESTLQMVFENNNLFPPGISFLPEAKEERVKYYEENYKKAISSFNIANEAILRNAPFIPKDIFQMFHDLRDLCKQQLISYRLYGNLSNDCRPYSEARDKANQECYDRTLQIDKEMKILLDNLRMYIASLDVLDKE